MIKKIDIKDNNPGIPNKDTIVIVNRLIGINMFIDETRTFNPYNTKNEKIIRFTTFFIISNIISFLI